MVVYDLECNGTHQFEGWFKNSSEFDRQLKEGLITCPRCGSEQVTKKPSSSNIILHYNKKSPPEAQSTRLELVEKQFLQQLHEYVESNYEDVGRKFTEEAIKIHYGETEKRNISGSASKEDVRRLNDEGVAVTALPEKPTDKNKLN